MAIANHRSTDLVSPMVAIEQFDQHLRPNIEAFILHTYYVELLGIAPDDLKAWTSATFLNFVEVVKRDRNFISTPANRQVSNLGLVV